MTLKQQQKNYLVSIQCENPANLINFMKKTYNTSFETIPIDYNKVYRVAFVPLWQRII